MAYLIKNQIIMSFWSKAIKAIVEPIEGVTKSIPIVGDAVHGVLGQITDAANEYEQKKALNDARGWQQYVQDLQNQFNAAEAEKSRLFNAEEAEKSRQFNAEEADKARNLSRQWQLEDWERETAYNSPANQLKLMKQAGLNPLLFNESVANTSTPSANSPLAASSSPASSSPASAGSGGQLSIVNPPLMAAQTRLANAEAEKAESDIDVNKTQNERIKALMNGEVKLQESRYLVDLSDAENKKAAAKLALKECEKIDAELPAIRTQLDQISQQLRLWKQQEDLTEKEIKAFDDRLQMEFRKILSDINRNEWQNRLDSRQIDLLSKQITYQDLQNGILSVDNILATDPEVIKNRKSLYISTMMRDTTDNYVDLGDFVNGQNHWTITRGLMRGAGQLFGGMLNGTMTGLKIGAGFIK